MQQAGFDGLMLSNVWNGLQIKKEKQIKEMPLKVMRADGSGVEKVVFQDVSKFTYPNDYFLVGTCKINNREHTFEYASSFGKFNSSIIGFLPQK